MYQILQQSLRNRESVILGDFNLPHIDWQTLTGVENESYRMLEFIDDSFLSHVVAAPTWENNILDLVITCQEHLINNITVGEHLRSCDHKVVPAEINPLLPGGGDSRSGGSFRVAGIPALAYICGIFAFSAKHLLPCGTYTPKGMTHCISVTSELSRRKDVPLKVFLRSDRCFPLTRRPPPCTIYLHSITAHHTHPPCTIYLHS